MGTAENRNLVALFRLDRRGEESVTVLSQTPREDTMNDAFTPAIAANIRAMAELLTLAADRAAEAVEAAEAGRRNEAIGAISDLNDTIAAALALHGAAVTLHRQ